MTLSLSSHARMRLRQRYGRKATPGLLWFLGHALEMTSIPSADAVVVLMLSHRGRTYRFVFDARHSEIITFLPDIDPRPGGTAAGPAMQIRGTRSGRRIAFAVGEPHLRQELWSAA